MAEYYVTAKLLFETAMHIGSGKGDEPTDAPIRRASDGRILIPGSAIAGSLRSTATRLAPRLGFKPCMSLKQESGLSKAEKENPCSCVVCQLFGDVNPVEKTSNNKGAEANASRLWIQDAFVDADSSTFVRDGVGIDRKSGHAVENVKFDYEVVPRGTTFLLNMRLIYNHIEEKTEQEIKLLLTAVLAEWVNGRGQLGGNISRGLGHLYLEDLTFAQPEFNSAADLVNYLRASNRAYVSQPDANWHTTYLAEARKRLVDRKDNGRYQSIAASFVKVSFNLKFEDLFLQNDPVVAMISGFDHAPLIEKLEDDGLGNPVLGGSSIRGVLRSQAGKIIRTLYTHYCLDKESHSADVFLDNCPSCNVLEDEKDKALAGCVSRLDPQKDKDRHHEWQEDDFCLTCQLFGNQERGSRLWIQDAVWQDSTDASWQAQDFLAIDRFTGGGLDGAKFDAAPLSNAAFKTTLTLQDPTHWELGLLILLLRDLAEKRITIGFGAAKGYGRVKATDFCWQVGYLTPEDLKDGEEDLFPEFTADDSGVYKLAIVESEGWLSSEWQIHAETWVTHFNETIKSFKKPNDLASLEIDTFFDKENGLSEVGQLYGRSRVEVS